MALLWQTILPFEYGELGFQSLRLVVHILDQTLIWNPCQGNKLELWLPQLSGNFIGMNLLNEMLHADNSNPVVYCFSLLDVYS